MTTLDSQTFAHPARRDIATGSALKHIPRLSCGTPDTGNKIVQGENLRVLSRLASGLRGAVRCIYIDPPYNNQERYHHFDDARSHKSWLDALVERLGALVGFLRDDGSLWISIDDREVHYLKVAADDVLGRDNFVSTLIWEQRTTRENRKVFSQNHEYVLVYARDARRFKASRNPLPPTDAMLDRYQNPDGDPRGPWQSVSANAQGGHGTASQFYTLVAPNGRPHDPPKGRCWVFTKARMHAEIAAGNVWFGRDGNNVPRLKRFAAGSSVGLTPETLWTATAVGTSDAAKKHQLALFPSEALFATPKPEELIHRVLQIASDPGDLVLDAYVGSGTTAAVAHKTGRRYIGIDEGTQAASHCAARLKQVIAGEAGGISSLVKWSGGGGFDFYRLP